MLQPLPSRLLPLPSRQSWSDAVRDAACVDEKSPTELEIWLAQNDFPGPRARTLQGVTTLMQAAWRGEDGIVEALLSAGVPADDLDDNGNTALWYACLHGGPATIARLVHVGTPIDHGNDDGISCLMQATASGQVEVAQLLLKLGATWETCAPDGRDALEMAVDRGHELLRLARIKASH